jgi:hypothetical protein
MIGKKIKVSYYNYYKKRIGNREIPFIFFYIFPMFTYSKTEKNSFSIHLGWFYLSLLIRVQNDHR